MPPVWQRLLADWHMCTHFFVDGDHDEVVWARGGTRSGDANADSMFVRAFRRVQAKLWDELVDRGLVASVSYDPAGVFGGKDGAERQVPVRPSTFLDDMALLMEDNDPRALLCKVEMAGNLLADTMRRYGLQINFKPGKTEALVVLCGRGSVAVR